MSAEFWVAFAFGVLAGGTAGYLGGVLRGLTIITRYDKPHGHENNRPEA
jgi:hypothetical protein